MCIRPSAQRAQRQCNGIEQRTAAGPAAGGSCAGALCWPCASPRCSPGAAQAAVPTTYQDFAYTSSVTSNPTADKPQSKLWYQDGSWWSLMLSPADNAVHIFELRADHTWRDTGTSVDSRANSTGDALWDDATGKLYVASRAASSSAQLVRLSYNAATRTLQRRRRLPGRPSAPGGSESITIAKDSTGKLWATFTRAEPGLGHALDDERHDLDGARSSPRSATRRSRPTTSPP